MCQDTINQVLRLINAAAGRFEATARQAETLMDAERDLFSSLMEVGRLLMERTLQTLADDKVFATKSHRKAREAVGPMRWKGRVRVRVKTLFGDLRLPTTYWVQDLKANRGPKRQKRRERGTGLYPILWMWGIYDRCTPAAQTEIARAMSLCSSCNEASELLATRGIFLDSKRVCRFAYSFGRRAIRARDKRLDNPGMIPDEEKILIGQRVAIALDGGRYRARINNEAGRLNGKRRRGFKTPWKEPKGFIIYVLNKEGRPDHRFKSLCDFVTEDADGLAVLLKKYLRAYGAEKAQELVFLADGAHWIWNRVAWLRSELDLSAVKITEVLDFYHAVEHLSVLCKLPEQWSDHRRKVWLTRQRRALKRGDLTKVQSAIATLGEDVAESDLALFKREQRYFGGENEARLDYADFEARKLPRGSGAIESVIRRVINQRVKSNGTFWKPENAAVIMHMRAQLKTSRFEDMSRHATSTYALAA